MLEIPPPLSFGRVGRLYNTTLLKIYTTIYDPICHRDIRPLELLFESNGGCTEIVERSAVNDSTRRVVSEDFTFDLNTYS